MSIGKRLKLLFNQDYIPILNLIICRVQDTDYSNAIKPSDNLGAHISKFNNLNMQKFKEHINNKINVDSRNTTNRIQVPILKIRNKPNGIGGAIMSVDKSKQYQSIFAATFICTILYWIL